MCGYIVTNFVTLGAVRVPFLGLAVEVSDFLFVRDNSTAPNFSTLFKRKKGLLLCIVSVCDTRGMVRMILAPTEATRTPLLESARVFVDTLCDGNNSISPDLSTSFAFEKDLLLGVVSV